MKYVNNIERAYNSSINFVFRYGEKSSTKVYIYDSLDKINQTESGFVNYLKETTLKGIKCLKISYEEPFYKDNSIYYIVLYDISQQYSDYVYVVNSLKDLTFGNEFSYKLNCTEELIFNFMIQKSTSTYLHYQTVETVTTMYFYRNYYIKIINDKGEALFAKNGGGISGYVKIEPNRKYYAQISIKQNTITSSSLLNKPEFLLNYEEYNENILLQGNSEIRKRILCSQHFNFFKDISDLSTYESITFKGTTDTSYIYQKISFYFQFYESNNFSSLINSFPSNKDGFDNQIKTDSIGSFNLKVKKQYASQKGLLFGVFIEAKDGMELHPQYLTIKAEKSNGKEEGGKEERGGITDIGVKDSSHSESSTSVVLISIVGFVIFVIIVSICIYWCNYANKRNRSNYVQPQQNYQDNQYPSPTPNNNYINNDYNSGVNHNTGTDYNNYYNKVETKNEAVYDYPPCPPINEN